MTILVTDMQLKVERKIQDVFNAWKYRKEITRSEGNEKIEKILEMAVSKNIFTQKDMRSYRYRRDDTRDNEPRDHLGFIEWMEITHVAEGVTFDDFIKHMTDKGRKPQWKNHGTDVGGFIMIANFKKRLDSPNKPDKIVRWLKDGGEGYTDRKYVEVKNMFGDKIWLKVDNLEHYKGYKVKGYDEKGTYLLIGFKSKYYFCKKYLVKMLLEKKSEAELRWGKTCITISVDGSNAHFSLNDLIEKKIVTQI
jgi:hypothetical protein